MSKSVAYFVQQYLCLTLLGIFCFWPRVQFQSINKHPLLVKTKRAQQVPPKSKVVPTSSELEHFTRESVQLHVLSLKNGSKIRWWSG